jgi:ABC-type phosphate transport system substrate-binding protein
MKKSILILLFLAAALFTSCRAQAQVIVIANSGVKLVDISKNDLRDLFNGASTNLKDGIHATPVLLKAGATHNDFLNSYIGKNDTAFRANWRSLVFSGQASMPKSLDSESDIVNFVSHNSGAIGYINKATPHDGVTVISVK